MTLATRMVDFLASRAALDVARSTERTIRDAFILLAFPELNTRLEALIADAAGTHSQVVVTVTPQTLAVTGRTFATLPQRVVTLAATVDGVTMNFTFTPTLDFRLPDQFGRIEFVADFEANPRRSRAAAIAQSLLSEGIHMRGTTSAHLMILIDGRWTELSASHLEDALSALIFR